PLGERGGVVGHACDGAAHLVDVDLALGAGGGEVDRAEPVDQLVVECGEVGGLEVGVGARGPERVEQGLQCPVGHGAEQVGDRLGHRAQRPDRGGALVDRTGRGGQQGDHLFAVPVFGDHRQRRRGGEVDQRRDLVGRVGGPGAKGDQQVARGGGGV